MREAAMPPDPGKPLPQDVLKILSFGIKFENVLAGLCHEGEETISSFENDVKDLKSMTDPEHLSFLKEKNIIASLSLHGEEIDTTSSQGKDVCPDLSCGGQIQSSEMVGTLNAKVVFHYVCYLAVNEFSLRLTGIFLAFLSIIHVTDVLLYNFVTCTTQIISLSNLQPILVIS